MAAGEVGNSSERPLTVTPTWAVSFVCAVIIIISILLEQIIHKLASLFSRRHKTALVEALEKVKSELMVLGFISLLLTFFQSYIQKICVPVSVATTMLPCVPDNKHEKNTDSEEHHRRLLWNDHRYLAAVSSGPACKEGYQQLISLDGLHQLHILIFFLAVFHVIYSAATMLLGRLKIRGFKAWEQETSSDDYEFSNDHSRFRLTHETSFVKSHTRFWTKYPFFFYIGCFFRQFYRSVSKTDYLTLRNGFITVHLDPSNKFNFQKYIKRSLEDDFKLVVGVSPVLWASFVLFLLMNVNGWGTLYWASFIPVIIILAVGTKLQAILTDMALDITNKHAVVQGIPLVQASDKHFWFGRPRLMIHLIHFALFQNAFQITYYLWLGYSFGWNSCFHDSILFAIGKVVLGLFVLILCSYIALPLYALVTQMGSQMKKTIFDEQTSRALINWRNAVKKKNGREGRSPVRTFGRSASPSPTDPSIVNKLHHYNTTGHIPRRSTDGHGVSNLEAQQLSPTSPRDLIVKVDNGNQELEMAATHHENEACNENEFSFGKPAPTKDH